ncbi:MAG TPA: rhodanese-like domain-containing protein [Armatimonadota bacterium]|jgi:rhodanese-related sulfurtransferase
MVSVNELPWKDRLDASPEEVERAFREGARFRVLDVRTHPEFAAYHIPGAMQAPIDTLPDELEFIDRETDWIVVCEHGVRSRAATGYLRQNGFDRVCNMVGGMARWRGAIERGAPADHR